MWYTQVSYLLTFRIIYDRFTWQFGDVNILSAIFAGFFMRHSVAKKIREKIEEQHLSVQAFERKAGLKIHAVHNILSGKSTKPSIDVLIAVAKTLGCTVNDLVSEEDEKLPQQKKKLVKYTNLKLMAQTLSYLATEFENVEKGLDVSDIDNAIQEIYAFCEKNKGGAFDEGFANWWVTKMKENAGF